MQFLSKFSKLFLSMVLSLTCLFSALHSKINIEEIKDLYNVLSPEYERLSPLFGAMLWETDYIKNVYVLAPESPTQKLVQELFYQQPTDKTVDVTHNSTNIATYFTPQIIGQLVRNMVLFLAITEKDRKYKKLTESIKSIILPLIFENKDQKTIKKNVSDKISNEIKANLKPTPEKFFETRVKTVANNLVGAIKEENKLYPPYHTIFILLSFMWKKETSKQAFWDYFMTLKEKIPNLLKPNYSSSTSSSSSSSSSSASSSSSSTSSSSSSSAYGLQDFLKAKYEFKDYDKLSEKTGIDDYEVVCFLWLGFNLIKNPLPPHLDYSHLSVKYKDQAFSDCGETALLNILNAIFYVSGENRFDLALIKKLNPSVKLFQFYVKYEIVTALTNPEVHNDWAQVVSELPGVVYAKGVCDIHAGLNKKGIDNFLRVLGSLFPQINTLDNTNTPTIKIFNALLIKAESNIRIAAGDIQDISDAANSQANHQVINLTIEKPNTIPLTITLKIYDHHFAAFYPQLAVVNFEKYRKDILAQFEKGSLKTQPVKFIKYGTLGKALGLNIDEALLTQNPLVLYSLLMQKVDSAKALELMQQIAEDKVKLEPKVVKELFLNLYEIITQDDLHLQQVAFTNCFRLTSKGVPQIKDLQLNSINRVARVTNNFENLLEFFIKGISVINIPKIDDEVVYRLFEVVDEQFCRYAGSCWKRGNEQPLFQQAVLAFFKLYESASNIEILSSHTSWIKKMIDYASFRLVAFIEAVLKFNHEEMKKGKNSKEFLDFLYSCVGSYLDVAQKRDVEEILKLLWLDYSKMDKDLATRIYSKIEYVIKNLSYDLLLCTNVIDYVDYTKLCNNELFKTLHDFKQVVAPIVKFEQFYIYHLPDMFLGKFDEYFKDKGLSFWNNMRFYLTKLYMAKDSKESLPIKFFPNLEKEYNSEIERFKPAVISLFNRIQAMINDPAKPLMKEPWTDKDREFLKGEIADLDRMKILDKEISLKIRELYDVMWGKTAGVENLPGIKGYNLYYGFGRKYKNIRAEMEAEEAKRTGDKKE